jgi:hypothetical protein
MRKAFCFVFMIFLSIGTAIGLFAGAQQEYAFLAYPLEKIKPREMPAAVTHATVRLAGNEYETVLIGVGNPGSETLEVNGIMIARSGKSSLSLSCSRIEYIPVTQSSRWFAPSGGLWPDPVVPIEAVPGASGDGAPGEIRWVFEKAVGIPRGENRVFILEIYQPAGARSSEDLAVAFDSPDAGLLPLELRVESWDFDLPRESAMATSFGFSRALVALKHAALSTVEFSPEELAMDYLHMLARFRISVARPDEESPASIGPDGALRFDWRRFERLTGRLLDGTLFQDAPPSSSFMTPNPPSGLAPGQDALFYSEVAAHMREKGWLSRMFYYLSDEPLRIEYPAVREEGLRIKRIDPGIRTLVAEPNAPELEGAVDIWCLDIPFIGDSLPLLPVAARWPYRVFFDFQLNPSPSRYQDRRACGEDTWIYTCNSAVFLDYPNLFIDSEAGYSRIIPWLAFRWGFMGLLYWQTVYGYSLDGDPWKSPYIMMANGDGNLMYPGLPGLPDIKGHCPVPSLRLYLLRDGMEDYEYLAMLSLRAGEDEARKMAKRAAGTSLEWLRDIRKIQAIRDEAARRIEAAERAGQ